MGSAQLRKVCVPSAEIPWGKSHQATSKRDSRNWSLAGRSILSAAPIAMTATEKPAKIASSNGYLMRSVIELLIARFMSKPTRYLPSGARSGAGLHMPPVKKVSAHDHAPLKSLSGKLANSFARPLTQRGSGNYFLHTQFQEASCCPSSPAKLDRTIVTGKVRPVQITNNALREILCGELLGVEHVYQTASCEQPGAHHLLRARAGARDDQSLLHQVQDLA